MFLDFNFNCHGSKKLSQKNGAINFNFLCNNVKSLQTFKKLLKLFNYLKKIFPNDIFILTRNEFCKGERN